MRGWKVGEVISRLCNIVVGTVRNILGRRTSLSRRRQAVCGRCPSRRSVKVVGDVCMECGCVIASKALVDKERCRLGKWDELNVK